MKVLRTQFCDRIREFRESTGLSQAAFASKYGVTKSSYQKYELGLIQPGADAIEKLLAAGVNANWLLTGEGPMLLGDQASGTYPTHQPREHAVNQTPAAYSVGEDAGYVEVPFLEEVRAAAGHGAVVGAEHVSNALKFNESWLRQEFGVNPASLVVITVAGNSMEPTMRSGDLILIDTSVTRFNMDGAIYVMRDGDMLIVKRVCTLFGGGIEIVSDNPAFERIKMTADELSTANFSVIGRVIWGGKSY